MQNFKTAFLSSLVTIVLMSIAFAYFYYTNDIAKAAEYRNEATTPKIQTKTQNAIPASQKDRNKEITFSRQNIITETVKKVSPAVVGINVTEIRKFRTPWSSDPFFSQFFGDRVFQQEIKSLGSGAVISPDGYIITNDHVAGNAVKIIVTMTNGKKYDAKLVGTDKVSDISLLKIDAHDLPYIKMGNSDNVLIGEWAIALGNPFGLFEINDKPTVTVGVISATGMNLGSSNNHFYLNMLQTDAAINSGNSGGPLVNSLGELIGMNTLIYSKTGGSIGVGFAIPINKIKRIVKDLKEKGYVDRNFWTGLSIQAIDEGIARYYGLKSTRGVIVTNVIKDSPASKAGIKIGDIILKVNNYRIDDESMLIGVLQEYRTNDIISLHIIRENKPLVLKMKLESRND